MPLARVCRRGRRSTSEEVFVSAVPVRHYAPENLRVVIRACPSFHQCCWQCERRTLQPANAATPSLLPELGFRGSHCDQKAIQEKQCVCLGCGTSPCEVCGSVGSGPPCHQPFRSRSHFASRARSRACFLAMAFCFRDDRGRGHDGGQDAREMGPRGAATRQGHCAILCAVGASRDAVLIVAVG